MKYAISIGHSILKNGNCTSASGEGQGGVNEYEYNKKLVKYITKYLKAAGHKVTVIQCPEKKFTTASQEKSYKLPIINSGNYDVAVELHLNASDGKGNGTEQWYKTASGKKYADAVQKKMKTLFKDRGNKQTNGLYFLNGTEPPAIIIETFFCDNKCDCTKGKDLEKIGKLIAEGLAGKSINLETSKSTNASKQKYTTIKKTSSKAAIKWMQKKLNALVKGDDLVVDGIWGAKTQAKLEKYWKQLGWKKGTYCGKKTCKALYANRKK